jgi:Abnormal spindle-like microcephaly-assoc'd, ASPM-SPD-2-Hydin
MVVSIRSRVSPLSSPVASVFVDVVEKEFSSTNTLSIQSRTGLLQPNKWGKILLLVLACYLTFATAGCGTGIAMPVDGLHASPTAVNFGDVPVNQEVDGSVLVSNSSSAPLTISKMSITGGAFSIKESNDLPISIPAGSNLVLKVGFTPAASTDYSGQLTVMDPLATPMAQIPLRGHGSSSGSAQLTLSDTALGFGGVAVNSATTRTLTLKSTGSLPLTINSAAISGAGFAIVGGGLPTTLSPNQSTTLQVQFKPTAVGSASGRLTLNSNAANGGTTAVVLSGTGAAATTNPQLSVSPTSLGFGSVTVNTAKAMALTLTSTGTSAVTVNSAAISGAGFTIVGGSLPVTINSGRSMTLQVQFKPTATGGLTGKIMVGSNSTKGSTTVIALSGTGVAATNPQLTVSPTSLGFGSVTVNTAKVLSLVLTSTGTSAVTVNSAVITGAGFTIVSGSLPTTLNPQQSVTLQVQFKPTATGAASGQITVSSNSTNGSSTVVALGGTGAAAANPQLTVSPTSLAFGSVTVNTPTIQTLTLQSTGTSAVTVNSAAITGAGFTIVSQAFPVTLNPQQSMTLQVQFNPTATRAASGQIAVSSNSTSGSPAVVALSGTGTAANPQLTVSSTSLSFGSIAVNTATTLSVTLKSTGTTPVTVNSAAITGTGFSTIGGSFPVTLNPSGTATVQVQFKPTTAGTVTGKMTISSDSGSGGTVAVSLSGIGTTIAHQVNLSWTAPASTPDPVKGYNIYRSTGSGTMTLMNASVDTATSYMDSTVASGTSYNYVVKSVDSSGVESVGSNQIEVAVP